MEALSLAQDEIAAISSFFTLDGLSWDVKHLLTNYTCRSHAYFVCPNFSEDSCTHSPRDFAFLIAAVGQTLQLSAWEIQEEIAFSGFC